MIFRGLLAKANVLRAKIMIDRRHDLPISMQARFFGPTEAASTTCFGCKKSTCYKFDRYLLGWRLSGRTKRRESINKIPTPRGFYLAVRGRPVRPGPLQSEILGHTLTMHLSMLRQPAYDIRASPML
jgi:hypothetical protein